MSSGFDIDVSGATEALNAAGGFTAAQSAEVGGGIGADQNVTPNEAIPAEGTTPQLPTTVVPGTEPVAPTEPASPEGDGQDTITPRADLDALLAGVTDPAARTAVETAYKSFQGAATKKFQEAAELRKQYESLGDPQTIQTALELQTALQDPRAWQSLHQELTEGLRAMGMSPAEAHAAATDALDDAATESELPDLSALEDPELSPFKEHITKLHEELNGIKSEWAQAREEERLQQVQMAMSGELQRQENIIREARPDLKDEDITAIWEMSAFYDGNLLEANKALDTYAQRRLENYVAGKQAAVTSPTVPAPVAGGDTTTESPRVPATLDDAHAAAIERLRLIESQG